VAESITMGIGPALRKARVSRGVSIQDAARDTRIRAELLDALEQEQFDRLLGDVYVRGCLRSYAAYLGLSPDRVVERYADREEPAPSPTTTPPPMPPAEPRTRRRRRDDHRLIGMIAATALILAGASGLLSSRNSTPEPARLSTAPPLDTVATTRTITVGVLAERGVDLTVRIDDTPPASFHLRAGEGRSFEAQDRITIRLSDGGAADVTVSGRELGTPGVTGKPWRETYRFGSPSPSPLPSPSA
jgi:cytoskeleton protein RodZ